MLCIFLVSFDCRFECDIMFLFHVRPQRTRFVELALTHFALIRSVTCKKWDICFIWMFETYSRLTGVNARMWNAIAALTKPPTAVLTFKRSFTCKKRDCMFVCFFSECLKHTQDIPVWTRRWFFNVLRAVNLKGQYSHAYRLSLVWIRLCFVCGKVKLYRIYWTKRWFTVHTIELDVVNPDPQISHTNGWAPSWMRWCEFNSPLLTNDFGHSPHWYGFNLLWRIMCCLKLALWPNPLPQTEHKNGRSPL